MCTYYHTSNLTLVEGQQYSIADFDGKTTYDHARRIEEEKVINRILNDARPDGVQSRIKCIYLFRNLIQCFAYARSNHMVHIYEVRADANVFGPYPMTLVTTLYRCAINIRQDVIREYWHPTYNWKVLEFLTNSITIEREIQIGNGGFNMDDFIDDRQLSRRIFNF